MDVIRIMLFDHNAIKLKIKKLKNKFIVKKLIMQTFNPF